MTAPLLGAFLIGKFRRKFIDWSILYTEFSDFWAANNNKPMVFPMMTFVEQFETLLQNFDKKHFFCEI
jgi:hypothetical protein